MKILILTILASLAALFLYPIVLSVGKKVAHRLKQLQEEVTKDDDSTTN